MQLSNVTKAAQKGAVPIILHKNNEDSSKTNSNFNQT
jgi:hypothetical protein